MKARLTSGSSGFTMIEQLLAFSITLMIVSMLPVFGTLVLVNQDFELDSNLETGLAQLGNDLVTARKIQYGSTLVYQDPSGQENQIRLDGNRLIRTPGYVIYCSEIEEISFYEVNQLIYLSLATDGHQNTYLVGSDYEQ